MSDQALRLRTIKEQAQVQGGGLVSTGGKQQQQGKGKYTNNTTTTNESKGHNSGAVGGGDSEYKPIEQNALSYNQWFFFCQQCRHGGHRYSCILRIYN